MLQVIQHRYPLHRISYCADDKSDKRMFTFIAKEADSSKHHCFVFDSDKCVSRMSIGLIKFIQKMGLYFDYFHNFFFGGD